MCIAPACSGKRKRAKPAPANDTAHLSDAAAAHRLPIFVDDEQVMLFESGSLRGRKRLGSVVPPKYTFDSWTQVVALADGKRKLVLSAPAKTFAAHELALFEYKGRLALGVFRTPKRPVPTHLARALDKPTLMVDGLRELRILTTPPKPAITPTTNLHLKLGRKTLEVSAAMMAKLPRLKGREGGGRGSSAERRARVDHTSTPCAQGHRRSAWWPARGARTQ